MAPASGSGTGRRNWTRWGLIFLGWTLIGLFFGSQFYLSSALGFGMPTAWYRAFTTGLADWYLWGLLAPLIFWSGRRFRLGGGIWSVRLLLHLLASVVISLIQLVLTTCFAQLLESTSGRSFPFLAGLRFALAVKFHWNVVVYWAILGFSHALAYYRESRERALRTLQLESQLAQARLQALKMQLNPHFLFNALNTISQLIYEEPENADRMITHLGELLRLSLEAESEHQVTLRQELEFLERYLAIQKARFGDRLTIRFDIDPGLQDVLVPTLILQPFVENAIRHGVGPRSAPGRIDIQAYGAFVKQSPTSPHVEVPRNSGEWGGASPPYSAGSAGQGSRLYLRVSDNGPGLPGGEAAVKEGVGLGNTRARLMQLYGADQSLEFSNGAGGGLVVTLSLPLRTRPVEIAAAEEGKQE